MSPPPDATIFIAGGRVVPGTKLNGVYEVETALAPGGMGEVYKGHEIFSGKKVAIKFIRRELEENPDARQMFLNEGHSLGELHHDAIVRCFPLSVDPTLGRVYLPMEFVEGPSLADLVDAGPLSLAEGRLLLRRIAAGLQAAHERRIFHRDVSPDNIIVPDRDMSRAKIIDFGIARSTETGAVTVIGAGFAGKHNYVSPEQCGLYGGDVLAQSDIYSLGLVLAGALLGKPLDMGGSLAQVTTKRQVVPDLGAIDPAIRPVIEAMLRPDPRHRPASMSAVIDLLAPTTVALPRKRDAPVRPWVPLAAGLLVAAAAVGVWASGWNPFHHETVADVQAHMRRFAADYAAPPCTLVTADEIGAISAAFTGFGADPAALGGFAEAFHQRFGLSPDMTSAAIAAPQQCAVLDFGRTAARSGAPTPGLALISPAGPRHTLKSGRIVSGTIDAAAEASVTLLRVDENGTVQDLTGSIKVNGAERTFQARLDRSPDGAAGAQPQLLLALASASALPLPPLPATTATFFTDLAVAAPKLKAGAALAVFNLEK